MDSALAPNQSDVTEGPTEMVFIVEPLALRIFRLTLYVIIFLLATFGNALVIFVVYKTRELHTGKSFPFCFLQLTVFLTKATKRITEVNDKPSTPLIKLLCHPKTFHTTFLLASLPTKQFKLNRKLYF